MSNANEQVNPKALEALGLRKLTADRPKVPRVVWLVAGKAKTGKSHLAFDGPGPLGYINIDAGEEGTVEKFVEGDGKFGPKDIWAFDVRITRDMISGKDADVTKAKCEPLLVKSLKAYDEMLLGSAGEGLRTIIVDTWTEFFQLGCFARIGKDKQIMPTERTKVNGIYSSMIHDALYGTKNVILLAKTSEFDGVTKISGYNQSEGLVQTVIWTDKKEVRVKNEDSDRLETKSVITYKITDCRQNRDLEGEVFDSGELGEHPFAQLAAMIVPGTKVKDWR